MGVSDALIAVKTACWERKVHALHALHASGWWLRWRALTRFGQLRFGGWDGAGGLGFVGSHPLPGRSDGCAPRLWVGLKGGDPVRAGNVRLPSPVPKS